MNLTPYFEHPIDKSSWHSLLLLCGIIGLLAVVGLIVASIERDRKIGSGAGVVLLLSVAGIAYSMTMTTGPIQRIESLIRSEAPKTYQDVANIRLTEIEDDPRAPSAEVDVTTRDGQRHACSIYARDFDKHVYDLLCEPPLKKR